MDAPAPLVAPRPEQQSVWPVPRSAGRRSALACLRDHIRSFPDPTSRTTDHFHLYRGAYCSSLSRVSKCARQLRQLLCTSLLVLMVLGLLTRPVVTAVSEMHAVAHLELVAHKGGEHSHGDGATDAEADNDRRSGDGEQPGHTDGPHGLMHQAAGGAFDRSVAALEVPVLSGRHLLVSAAGNAARMPERLSSPFRPPIA